MTRELIERSRRRHGFADAALIVTTVALVVSLVIAVTVVSIGIARADTLVPIAESGSGRFALAILLALVIAGMGGLTAAMVGDGKVAPRRD
jgi:ABC-type antimicrobial peptide transport system ATPase subunit